jgi:hypothetical protein
VTASPCFPEGYFLVRRAAGVALIWDFLVLTAPASPPRADLAKSAACGGKRSHAQRRSIRREHGENPPFDQSEHGGISPQRWSRAAECAD